MPAGPIREGQRGAAPSVDAHRASTVRLAAEVASARRAREFVRSHLDGVDQETLDTTLLVATELVTNAVLHAARPPIDLSLAVARDSVVVQVFDCEEGEPLARPLDVERSDGRGIALVAMVSRIWGTSMHDGGKTVWAVIDRTAPAL